MIIKVPQSSEYQRVMIEIVGEDVLRRIEASTDVPEITPRLPDCVNEDGLTVTAQFLNEAHEPKGDVIVLQEPEEPEEPEEVDEVDESYLDEQYLEEEADYLDQKFREEEIAEGSEEGDGQVV